MPPRTVGATGEAERAVLGGSEGDVGSTAVCVGGDPGAGFGVSAGGGSVFGASAKGAAVAGAAVGALGAAPPPAGIKLNRIAPNTARPTAPSAATTQRPRRD